jgi:5'-3' exonuclease
MILIDYNQIALSNIIVQKLNDEQMIRHMILNSIRMYNKKYREKYGQMVICCDGMNTWRKEYFPQYKAARKKNRDEQSDTDWPEIFRILNLVRDEIKENLPYKVIHLEGCEADDVIGALTLEAQEFGKGEPIKIISSDKDFIQLHRFNDVSQFSPMQKKEVTDKNPHIYRFNHIMKGDKGDGIPNVKSGDNVFVDSVRQTPVSAKQLEEWLDNAENLKDVLSEELYRNYQRNKTLIDLSEIPKPVYEKIINTFDNTKKPMQMKVLNYLIKKRCNLLIECVEEFYNNG